MLIQAQYQKERGKQCKITASESEIKNNDNDNEADKSTGDEAKEVERGRDEKRKSDQPDEGADVDMADITSSEERMETDADVNATGRSDESRERPEEPKSSEEATECEADGSAKNDHADGDPESAITIEENVPKSDLYANEINIDPRTYCKLGHFHLLLEDYAKGPYFCRMTTDDRD